MAYGGENFFAGFFVLFLSQTISSAAASCSGMSQSLAQGCSISDDCSTITCNMDFVQKQITLKLKVNKCDEPVTVTATMDVPDLYVTWSHKYTSDDIIEVPGFTVSIPGIFSAGVYVQVGLTDKGNRLRLKVNLLAGGKLLGAEFYPVKATVMEGDLPISTDECGIFGWWYKLKDGTKAAVIGGPLLILIITCCCCCCCCCGCCKSQSTNHNTRVFVTPAVGPSVTMATTNNITIPMRQMVNTA